MKKRISIISCLLASAVCAGAAVAMCGCGDSSSAVPAYTRCDVNGDENSSGEYIKFGSYPQTKVTDGAVITSLDDESGSLPTNGDSQSWTSYKYYANSDNSTDFMWYIDVSFDGATYRGVYFTSYLPYYCDGDNSVDDSYQDDNGYKTGKVYWFKYEPILWRILSEDGDTALVLSETLVDSQRYYRSYTESAVSCSAVENYDDSYYSGGGSTSTSSVYDNNYKYSDIRAWLNENFYNAAFTSSEKAIIKTTAVDNSSSSTADYDGYVTEAKGYSCEDTNDKVFLLSKYDSTNPTYGFSSCDAEDAVRQKKPSDYAKSQGCQVLSYDDLSRGDWWLRSPSNGIYYCVWGISLYGRAEIDATTWCTSLGVLPALTVSLK